MAANEITTTEMGHNNTVTKAEEPLRITTKDLKKVEQGKKLAEWNRKN